MKKSVILSLGIVFFISCTKDKNVTTTYPSVSEPDSPYTISTATVFSGEFVTSVSTTTNGTTVVTGATADANVMLYQPPCSTCAPLQPVNVNEVKLNTNVLNIVTTGLYYSPSSADLSSERWQVKGNNNIPSFIYTNSGSAPDSDRNVSLPDSVSRAAGFIFSLNNVINADAASGIFFYNMSNPAFRLTKPIVPGNNSISITSTDLASFPLGQTYFQVTLNNSTALNFYTKDFKFSKQRLYGKVIKIIP